MVGPGLRRDSGGRQRRKLPVPWREVGLVGRALRSDKLGDTLLPKTLALPVFASDALSSSRAITIPGQSRSLMCLSNLISCMHLLSLYRRLNFET